MTDEKVVQLAEKYRAPLGWFGENVRAAIREAYDVGRRDGLEEAAKLFSVDGRLSGEGELVLTVEDGVETMNYIPHTQIGGVDD